MVNLLPLSTIEALLEGKKELFKSLYAENNWNWSVTYPVIKFDFSNTLSLDIPSLKKYIIKEISRNVKKFNIKTDDFEEEHLATSFMKALELLNEKTDKRIVFLSMNTIFLLFIL